MARKPTGGKTRSSKKKGETEQPDVVETTLLYPKSELVLKLAKAKLKVKKSNGSASGDLGQSIGKSVENDHLDRKAFGIASQFWNMLDADPEKMARTYFHMVRYLKDLGIPEKAAENKGMFSAEETGPGLNDGEEADEETAGNVTHIGTAARKVAERAGEQA